MDYPSRPNLSPTFEDCTYKQIASVLSDPEAWLKIKGSQGSNNQAKEMSWVSISFLQTFTRVIAASTGNYSSTVLHEINHQNCHYSPSNELWSNQKGVLNSVHSYCTGTKVAENKKYHFELCTVCPPQLTTYSSAERLARVSLVHDWQEPALDQDQLPASKQKQSKTLLTSRLAWLNVSCRWRELRWQLEVWSFFPFRLRSLWTPVFGSDGVQNETNRK